MRIVLRRLFVIVIVIGGSFALGAHAFADNAKPINVPAGDLVAALDSLAKQSGAELVYSTEQLKGRYTKGVSGALSARDAVETLLERTPLKLSADASGAMLIAIPSRSSAAEAKRATPAAKERTTAYALLRPVARLAQAQPIGPAGFVSVDKEPQSEKLSEKGATLEEIVVTGSRIARSALEQPTPITVISAAAIEESGFSNAGDILNQVSQFGVGTGLSSNQEGYFTDAGATFLNLRGLGTNRTLVLVDGLRRVSGGSSSSAVDLSTLPANMIERIEIITGGASSIYGADAVSGVVNIILKHHAEGLELSARSGISSRGDNTTPNVSATYGQALQDRGEFTFGVSWSREAAVHAERRPWAKEYNCDFPNPNVTAANPYTNIEYFGCRFPNTTYGSASYVGNTQYTVNADGSIRAVQNGARPLPYLGTGGGDGFNNQDFLLLRPQFSVLASQMHFAYDLGASVKLTEDFQFSYTNTWFSVQPPFDYGLTINRSNPFIPAALGALMDQNAQTTLSLGRTDTDHGNFIRVNDRTTYNSVTKFDGNLGSDFKWMVFYDYGRYNNDSQFQNERIKSRFLQAVDVIAGPNGPTCADLAAVAAGCKPLNLFGPTSATPAALAWIHTTAQTRIINTLEVAGAQLTGKLFRLPAGALSISSGVEYRKESQTAVQDTMGAQNLLFNPYGPSSYGTFNVKEAFVEALAPILKDQPFAKALEVEAAARLSDYDTIGHTKAWKLGAQWAPTADVRFRITRSSSVRAPNLTELFSPGVSNYSGYYDPCSNFYINAGSPTRPANCAKLGVPANFLDPLAAEGRLDNTVGNPALSAETAKSWTVGTVLTPRFLPRLTWTIDWWSIDLTAAINSLPDQKVINGCVDGPTPSATLCPLVTRGGGNGQGAGGNLANAITLVTLEPLNIGILKAEGIDTSASYYFDLPTHVLSTTNQLRLSLDGSYTIKNNSIVDAHDSSSVIYTAGDYTLPKVRANLTVAFLAGPLMADLRIRYIGKSKVDVNSPPLFTNDNNVSSRTYSDVFASLVLGPKVKLSAGISNVFDTAPPQTATTYTGTSTLFDVVGRYYFGQVTAKF